MRSITGQHKAIDAPMTYQNERENLGIHSGEYVTFNFKKQEILGIHFREHATYKHPLLIN